MNHTIVFFSSNSFDHLLSKEAWLCPLVSEKQNNCWSVFIEFFVFNVGLFLFFLHPCIAMTFWSFQIRKVLTLYSTLGFFAQFRARILQQKKYYADSQNSKFWNITCKIMICISAKCTFTAEFSRMASFTIESRSTSYPGLVYITCIIWGAVLDYLVCYAFQSSHD